MRSAVVCAYPMCYLHSSMERLKVGKNCHIRTSTVTFTFQYGEIKRLLNGCCEFCTMEFTFQYGEIKSVYEQLLWGIDKHLHSSMERLKVLMHQKGVTAYRDLHSSMERLKAFLNQPPTTLKMHLHSSMERLKVALRYGRWAVLLIYIPVWRD